MNKMQTNQQSPFTAGMIVVLLAVLTSAGLIPKLHAAVGINTQQFFDALPPVADWSTRTVAGGGGAPVTIADLEILVQTNTAAGINTVLGSSATMPPSANALARWNSTARFVQTLPTGNAVTILMATIQNTTGSDFPSPVISYDFLVPSPVNSEDAGTAGHIVYYSLTGLENSWVNIPALTSAQPTPVAGSVVATLSLGSWPADALLYVIWVDDNGNGAVDGSFAIDNFLVSANVACPEILTQPSNTNNLVGRTVSMTVQAQGPGLTYQWNKVGAGAVDPIANPTALKPTLVITNAQASDTGDYNVTVANICGFVTSGNAHIQIDPDLIPPRLLSASAVGPGLNTFRLTTDEELCGQPDPGMPGFCGGDYHFGFNWHIYQSDDLSVDLGVQGGVQINATTYEFTTELPRDPAKQYRITVAIDFGEVISDLYQNFIPAVEPAPYAETGLQISFQQGDANGYAGTQDTQLNSGANAALPLGANPLINVDNNDGGVNQALLRFDNIFGPGSGQVPVGSLIASAILTLNQNNNGNPATLHRMLVGWDQSTATWDSLVGGVAADGTEAVVAPDALSPGLNGVTGPIQMDVTASVRAWAGGQANNGWALIPGGNDGWRWDTSESGPAAPILTIEYLPVPCTGLPGIVTQPPATVMPSELTGFSISVGVANGCGTFQWTKDDADITGANGLTYSVASATAADNGSYRLRATNPDGSVTSAAAVVTVVPKTTRPHVTRVVNGANGTTITVAFNEPVASASAQSTGNYTLTPSVPVSSAVLGANNTVTLTTDPRTAGTAYSLRIAGVTDLAAVPNAIDPNPTIVSLTSANPVAGAGYGDAWLYNTNNLDGDPTWKDTGYTPGADWLTGNGLFGTEPSTGVIAIFPVPIATVIPPNDVAPGDFVTCYFRKSVTLPALPAGASYVLDHFIDDGAAFYWDGVEFGRFNMGSGAVVYSTRAATANEASRQAIRLPASASAGGTHTLAVEVHQGGTTTSSDVMFGAEILAVIPQPALSISHSGGANTVRWNGDSHWRLVRSAVVQGPYAAVAGNPFQSFVVPPAANTNSSFFMLEYVPSP